jgi:two-component system chemotaxis response regulator CheB
MIAPEVSVRRVLVCEDSPTFATGLTRLLERGHEFEVIAVCATAEEAIARLPTLKPDLVTMDLELPGMSGVEAIEQIMSVFPVPILVLSGHVQHRSDRALLALAAGALDAIPKGGLDPTDLDGPAARTLRHRAKVLSGVRVIRHPRARLQQRRPLAIKSRTASVIGICASTGGPQALAVVLAGIPTGFAIPILVVQHMSPGFIDGFARWLDTEVLLPVRLAEPGARPAPGIWVAPEGAHLVIDSTGRLALDTTTPGLHRPSGDVLLKSLAASYGANAVAVVLTGMGRDGAEGLADVGRAGGLTIAQDEETAVVFGMPRAAAQCGAEVILPLQEISSHLRGLRPIAEAH